MSKNVDIFDEKTDADEECELNLNHEKYQIEIENGYQNQVYQERQS